MSEPFTTEEIEARLAQARKQQAFWSRDKADHPYARMLALDVIALETLQLYTSKALVIDNGIVMIEGDQQKLLYGVVGSKLSGILPTMNEVQAENLRLRAALATSKSPCVYCSLPAEEWAKCQSGFPGCARADDASGCPEFGSMMENHDFRQAISDAIEKLEGHVLLTESVPGVYIDTVITTVIDDLHMALGIEQEETQSK